MVTDSQRVTLFVLARDPQEFRARFDKEVLAFVKAEGFTRFYNAPKATVQEPDCIYAGVSPDTEETKLVDSEIQMQEELDRILFRSD